MNKMQSSYQKSSKRIFIEVNGSEMNLSTQLEELETIHILEVCLKNLKEKTSQNVVPIGKENKK